jgi:hypothetical protein
MDTRNKRASALGIALAFRIVFPNPDGSLAASADRQQSAYCYAGIDAASITSFDAFCDTTLVDTNEDRTMSDTNEDRSITDTNEDRTLECT